MPLFLLAGGEIVIAFLLVRIVVWILGGRMVQQAPQPPPGPGRPRLIEGGPIDGASQPDTAAHLRRAA